VALAPRCPAINTIPTSWPRNNTSYGALLAPEGGAQRELQGRCWQSVEYGYLIVCKKQGRQDRAARMEPGGSTAAWLLPVGYKGVAVTRCWAQRPTAGREVEEDARPRHARGAAPDARAACTNLQHPGCKMRKTRQRCTQGRGPARPPLGLRAGLAARVLQRE
jgi:hypothetical protein